MHDYYVFFFDTPHHIVARGELRTDTERAAIEVATDLLMVDTPHYLAVEIWQGCRMVRRITHTSATRASLTQEVQALPC
jgi:hypothetical protein